MSRFEYDITTHSAKDFQELVYFCSDNADCSLEWVPVQQMKVLKTILNQRGLDGWELVQIAVGKDGVVVFWKREVDSQTVNSLSHRSE